MIYLHLGRDGDELALTWSDHVDTMLLLAEDRESLEIAVGTGYPIEEYGEKGWGGGKFYFYGALMHPTLVVQRFAHLITKYCPKPNWEKEDIPSRAEIAETLRQLQE